jgi:altronate dehydratase
MKFPGSKLLHQVDLSIAGVSLNEVLRSCRQVGLTGLAEVRFPDAMGMIFFYLGNEVNALFREGAVAHNGQSALDRLLQTQSDEGSVAVYELPLDIAHLLRGITQRRRLKEKIASSEEFDELLTRLENAEHTGTLEAQTSAGNAMLLLVRGRVSNVYWETPEGVTFEKGEARRRLERALTAGEASLVLSDFSQTVWKDRHEFSSPPAPADRASGEAPPSTEQLVSEEMSNRNKALDDLENELPSLLQAVFFDLMTGTIFARRMRGTQALRVSLLAERLPSLAVFIRDLAIAEDEDRVESIEIATERVAGVLAVVDQTQEGIAVLAEKSQPLASIHAALNRCVRDYVSRLRPVRKTTNAR